MEEFVLRAPLLIFLGGSVLLMVAIIAIGRLCQGWQESGQCPKCGHVQYMFKPEGRELCPKCLTSVQHRRILARTKAFYGHRVRPWSEWS